MNHKGEHTRKTWFKYVVKSSESADIQKALETQEHSAIDQDYCAVEHQNSEEIPSFLSSLATSPAAAPPPSSSSSSPPPSPPSQTRPSHLHTFYFFQGLKNSAKEYFTDSFEVFNKLANHSSASWNLRSSPHGNFVAYGVCNPFLFRWKKKLFYSLGSPHSLSSRTHIVDVDAHKVSKPSRSVLSTFVQLYRRFTSGGENPTSMLQGRIKSLHHCFFYSLELLKHHPYYFLLCIIILLIVISVVGLLVVLVCLPSLIQKRINLADIQLISAVLTNPEETQFDLSFFTEINHTSRLPFKLNSFEGNLFYTPFNVKPTHQVVRHLQDNAFRLSNTDFAYRLATMQVPSLTLKKQKSFSHEPIMTTVYIQDPQLFSRFLKDLVRHGLAEWTLRGSPSGTLAGIVFNRFYLEKQLLISSPKLFFNDPNADHEQENLQRHSIDKMQDTSNPDGLALKIKSLDMTRSLPSSAFLKITILMSNLKSSMIIDPLGILTFGCFYHGQKFVTLTTDTFLTLRPGDNLISLHGEIQSVNILDDPQRQIALSDMFSKFIRGESPALTTRGINSSIPLFSPAVEAVDITYGFKLFKSSNHLAADQGALDSTIQIIHTITLHEIQLFESMQYPETHVEIKGDLNVEFGNPFGRQTRLFVNQAYLTGTLVLVESILENVKDETIFLNKTFVIGEVTGTASGNENHYTIQTRPIRQMGVLFIEDQKMALQMNLALNFSETPQHFTRLIQSVFKNRNVILRFVNMSLMIDLTTPMGQLQLKKIPLSHEFSMKGFSGMRHLQVKSMSLHAPVSNEEHWYKALAFLNGPIINITARIPPTQQVRMYIGALALNLTQNGQHFVSLVAENCEIKPNEQTFAQFSGALILKRTTLGVVVSIYSKIQSQKRLVLQGTFVPVHSVNQSIYDDSPLWLRRALHGMTIDIVLNDKNDTEVVNQRSSPPKIKDVVLSGLANLLEHRSNIQNNFSSPLTASDHDIQEAESRRKIRPGIFLSNFLEGLQKRNQT